MLSKSSMIRMHWINGCSMAVDIMPIIIYRNRGFHKHLEFLALDITLLFGWLGLDKIYTFTVSKIFSFNNLLLVIFCADAACHLGYISDIFSYNL